MGKARRRKQENKPVPVSAQIRGAMHAIIEGFMFTDHPKELDGETRLPIVSADPIVLGCIFPVNDSEGRTTANITSLLRQSDLHATDNDFDALAFAILLRTLTELFQTTARPDPAPKPKLEIVGSR